jgi:hypothetical protein
VCLRNVRQEGGFGPKLETELLWLSLGRICVKWRWGMVHRGGGGGGGAVRSRNRSQRGGLGQNPKLSRCGLI